VPLPGIWFPCLQTKRHLDQFSRFCTAHTPVQQTDRHRHRQTDRRTDRHTDTDRQTDHATSVAVGRTAWHSVHAIQPIMSLCDSVHILLDATHTNFHWRRQLWAMCPPPKTNNILPRTTHCLLDFGAIHTKYDSNFKYLQNFA